LEKLFSELLRQIGEDPQREGLQRTPQRAAAALAYLTSGYERDVDIVVNNAIFRSESDEMIIVDNIEMYSLCEHHLLPFFGRCHVAYIPNGKIIGVSKIPRIIDIYSHRLQIQERLTAQIANTVMTRIEAQGVGVVIEARHMCMMMRGVRKQASVMRTSCMLGVFRTSSSTRAEFLNLISHQ